MILDFDSHLPKEYDYVASPIIGFAGANASGKTTILQALTFVLWFMEDSFAKLETAQPIPFEPFVTSQKQPTRFHLVFTKKLRLDDRDKWVNYEYELCLSQEKVLTEGLYYYPYGRKRVAYIRDENKVKFGATIAKFDTTGLRRNCSIVSFAAQFASQHVAIACKTYVFQSNVRHTGLKEETFNLDLLAELVKDDDTKHRVRELLKIADVGIEDIYWREEESLAELVLHNIEEIERENNKERFTTQQLQTLRHVLNSENLKIEVAHIFFRHRIGELLVDFTPDLESSGTLQFLALLHFALNALKDGTLLILDEIELKLHQNLVAYLVGMFENPSENKQGAQLIFSFHNTYLMEILKPSELWFTEKNDEGYTDIFSAVDFEDIKQLHNKNLEKLYRIGRFGATPRGI